MTLLKYTAIPTEASWDQSTYYEIVKVVKGYARTDDPRTVEALLYRGFEIVEEASDEATAPVAEAKPKITRKQRGA